MIPQRQPRDFNTLRSCTHYNSARSHDVRIEHSNRRVMIALAVVACSTVLVVLGAVVVIVLGRSDSAVPLPVELSGSVVVSDPYRIRSAIEVMLEVGWTDLSAITARAPRSGADHANIANIAKVGSALEAMLEVGWTSDLRAITVPAPGVGVGVAGLAEVGFWG